MFIETLFCSSCNVHVGSAKKKVCFNCGEVGTLKSAVAKVSPHPSSSRENKYGFVKWMATED